MNKIVRVILKTLMIILIIQIINTPVVRAESFWAEIFTTGEAFIDGGKSQVEQNSTINQEDVRGISSKIYNGLIALGVGLAVIIGGILGIQIMWGSIEQQVKAKEMLIPYAIGCVVIFGAFGIWKICIKIFSIM